MGDIKQKSTCLGPACGRGTAHLRNTEVVQGREVSSGGAGGGLARREEARSRRNTKPQTCLAQVFQFERLLHDPAPQPAQARRRTRRPQLPSPRRA